MASSSISLHHAIAGLLNVNPTWVVDRDRRSWAIAASPLAHYQNCDRHAITIKKGQRLNRRLPQFQPWLRFGAEVSVTHEQPRMNNHT
jgi:hypothetical protein